jgi:hypothetical protein
METKGGHGGGPDEVTAIQRGCVHEAVTMNFAVEGIERKAKGILPVRIPLGNRGFTRLHLANGKLRHPFSILKRREPGSPPVEMNGGWGGRASHQHDLCPFHSLPIQRTFV